jgi:ketosteroid isomerase-like protein
MIYSYIVARKLRQGFADLNRGDYGAVMALFGQPLEHAFFGEHALGGVRHKTSSLAPWYQRLAILFPDLQFTVQRLAVSGPPWNTVAMVE